MCLRTIRGRCAKRLTRRRRLLKSVLNAVCAVCSCVVSLRNVTRDVVYSSTLLHRWAYVEIRSPVGWQKLNRPEELGVTV